VSELNRPAPTISMKWVRYDEGHFGVELVVTGLESQQQAETAMAHMERQLCGTEIKIT
jgi:hypothetical protein